MDEKDIFSFHDIKDIPDDVRKETKALRRDGDIDLICKLFEIKSPLSLDEILVGLYRKFKIQKERKWLMSAMHRASRSGMVERADGKRGVYKLKTL